MALRSIGSATLVAGFAALCFGCSNGLGGILISDQDEVDLGAGVAEQIAYEYGLAIDEDPTTIWARELVAGLSGSSKEFRDPADIGGYKVEVIVDDNLVNAFAAPGGYTYIATGLILTADSCAEIAGVMGHELAHVTERHGVKQIEDQYTASVVIGWILNDGIAADVASALWSFLESTQFSQEHEAEADAVGLQIAHDAGYNPYGLAVFFQKLLALEQEAGVSMPQFLSSHPATADRVDAVTSDIEQLYGDTVTEDSPSWTCVGTTMQLDEIKAHILSTAVVVKTGTGEGPPADQTPEG